MIVIPHDIPKGCQKQEKDKPHWPQPESVERDKKIRVGFRQRAIEIIEYYSYQIEKERIDEQNPDQKRDS